MKTLIAAALLAVAGLPAWAGSAASPWNETDQTRLRLVASTETIGGTKDVKLGLQFELQPGWKVYWRSPGDAGFPPNVDWTGSRNLASAAVQWPAPERFSVLGLQTLGYKKQVVLPVSAKAVTSSQGVDLKARVRYLTCNDICIPYEAKLSLKLPPGTADPSAHAHLIDKYRSAVPGDGKAHGLKIDALHSVTTKTGARLQLVASAQTPFTAPDTFVEGAPGLSFGKPSVIMLDGGRRALIDVQVDGLDGLDDEKGQTIDNRSFVVTLVDGRRAAESMLVATPGAADLSSAVLGTTTPAPNAMAASSLLTILLLAVLGGLILNLMPCVLPVLSLKLLSLAKHGGGDAGAARRGFLASAAGIITAFLVLAGILAAMKAGGAVVGWGIQFQQPWFLVAMIALVTVFACNLWGFFDVRLPQLIGDASVRSTEVHGLGGHFLQGAFATLLATPCSAPFLGTAVGFALTGGTADIMMIFAALGVGLALPYLLIAAVPKLATWLPKPGPWMIKMKVILGFALAATGLWLLSVLAGAAGQTAAFVAGGLMVAVVGALYMAHRPSGQGLKLSAPTIIVAVLVAGLAPQWLPADNSTASAGVSDTIWQPFDEAAIPGLVAQGKTVYVDVTADWCITCLVNKGIVLADTQINELLGSGRVIAMQADWTKPDETISRYLAKHGRYGIPFNMVYGPKTPNGMALPELLTPGIVLSAFVGAAGDNILTAKK